MLKDSPVLRFFGLTQVVLLVAIGIAIFLHWRRVRDRKKGVNQTLNSIYIRDSIKRTPVNAQLASHQPQADSQADEPALQIESALPTWSPGAEPYEILGVPPTADPETVEAAYKKLLKRYHPDRFASWGKGYQNRAHQILLLAQKARDRMLKKT